MMNNEEVWAVIRETCERCGHPEIVDRICIKWSSRMTSSMGNASYKHGYYRIGLSTKLFRRTSLENQRNTVAHETCHIIDGIVNACRMSHGAGWKRTMRRAGYSDKRCHTVSNAGLVKRYVYECPNGCHNFALSTRMHNQINRGTPRACNKCHNRINFTGRIE